MANTSRTNSDRWFGSAWGAWALLQLLMLAIFAWRWPLSARMPAPIEQWASAAMAATQIGVSAMFAPILCGRLSRALLTFSIAIPMFVLSTLLAGERVGESITPVLIVGGWLLCLAGIFHGVREEVGSVTYAIVLLIGVAAPILAYLSAEYAQAGTAAWAWVSPTVALCFSQGDRWSDAKCLIVPALLAATMRLLLHVGRARLQSNSSPPAPTPDAPASAGAQNL